MAEPTPPPRDLKLKPKAGTTGLSLGGLQALRRKPAKKPDLGVEEIGKIVIDGTEYRWDPYCVEELGDIGTGGFGVIKKVRHVPSGKECAVKYIRNDATNLAKQNKYIKDEIKLTRDVESQFIVDCYGVAFWEGDVQVFLELMRMSLDKLIQICSVRQTFIPEDVLARINFCMVSGLDFLKERHQVMHRDIKPSNILMGFDGSIKLCDFGLSTVMNDSHLHSHVGSSLYLAPEKIEDRGSYDIRADVWSLGLTILELALLEFPFNVEKKCAMYALLQIIKKGQPKTIPEDRYSDECRSFVSACLQKTPADRPRYRRRSASSTSSEDETSPRSSVSSSDLACPLMEREFFLRGSDKQQAVVEFMTSLNVTPEEEFQISSSENTFQ